jgi:hypothetical protein
MDPYGKEQLRPEKTGKPGKIPQNNTPQIPLISAGFPQDIGVIL